MIKNTLAYLALLCLMIGTATAAAEYSTEQVAHDFSTLNFEEVLQKHFSWGMNPNFREFKTSPHHSGWKMHINADLSTCDDVAKIIVPYLLKNKIASKIMRDKSVLEAFSSDLTQRGKFITIYPSDYEQAKEISFLFDDMLNERNLAAPEPLFGDAQIGTSGFVFIRYGEHKAPTFQFVFDRGKRPIPSKTLVKRRGNHVSVLSMSGTHLQDEVFDERGLPFPEFAWHLNQKGLKGDNVLFEGKPLIWQIPGTDLRVDLNDSNRSWMRFLQQDFIVPHVTDKDLFVKVYDLMSQTLLDYDHSLMETLRTMRAQIHRTLYGDYSDDESDPYTLDDDTYVSSPYYSSASDTSSDNLGFVTPMPTPNRSQRELLPIAVQEAPALTRIQQLSQVFTPAEAIPAPRKEMIRIPGEVNVRALRAIFGE